MTRSVTKAMPIQFVYGKCHIKKRKGHKTALFGYYACLSCDLLVMSLGADTHTHNTHIHTDVHGRNNFKKPGVQAFSMRAPGLKN